MTKRTAGRLQAKLDKVWGHLCKAHGMSDYDELIARLRTAVKEKITPPPEWLHERARELYPLREPDTIPPERLFDILGLISDKQKAHSVLIALPESSASEIEAAVDFMLREFLPSQRKTAESIVDAFPWRRGGGPKTRSWPSAAICRDICEQIERLHVRENLPKGTAQDQMKERHGLSLRMVQRIWSDRAKYLKPDRGNETV
jgi:hypothetical protein